MHKDAEEHEKLRLAAEKDGGIRQAFSNQASKKSCCCVYRLAKEEVTHTTKKNSERYGDTFGV